MKYHRYRVQCYWLMRVQQWLVIGLHAAEEGHLSLGVLRRTERGLTTKPPRPLALRLCTFSVNTEFDGGELSTKYTPASRVKAEDTQMKPRAIEIWGATMLIK